MEARVNAALPSPAAKARRTRSRKSDAMTKHLLEIERLLGRRITPVELRSDLFRASRDLYVTVAQKQTEKGQ